MHRFFSCFVRARGEAGADDLPYATGNGDSGTLSEKIASTMFYCATNPDRGASGSVWALLPNGTVQRMEEAQETGSNGKPPEYTER